MMKYKMYKKRLKQTESMTEQDVVSIELINKLKTARKEKKITQAKLAEKSGLTQSQIAKFENYKSIPNLSTVLKITEALGYKMTIKKNGN